MMDKATRKAFEDCCKALIECGKEAEKLTATMNETTALLGEKKAPLHPERNKRFRKA